MQTGTDSVRGGLLSYQHVHDEDATADGEDELKFEPVDSGVAGRFGVSGLDLVFLIAFCGLFFVAPADDDDILYL